MTGLIYDSNRGQMPAASKPIKPNLVPGSRIPAPLPRWLPNYIDGPAGFASRGLGFPDLDENPARVGPPGRGPGPSPYEHAASLRARGGLWVQCPAGVTADGHAAATSAAPTVALGPANETSREDGSNRDLPIGFESIYSENTFEQARLENQYPTIYPRE